MHAFSHDMRITGKAALTNKRVVKIPLCLKNFYSSTSTSEGSGMFYIHSKEMFYTYSRETLLKFSHCSEREAELRLLYCLILWSY